jgi:hypothetical protein
MIEKFEESSSKLKEEKLPSIMEYYKPQAFVCENAIRSDEIYKKKGGQYIKYKTIPKWHHYAWDMINQISNSRKSFIFSKFVDEEEGTEFKKKIDMDTIILKLKLKIYNNVYEFFDDVMKMIRYCVDYMESLNSKFLKINFRSKEC